jgi:TolB-like protein/DNA-binding winged helix-turn-helix (wHTH) protein/tetratricopeptide (TPR) repeat protein
MLDRGAGSVFKLQSNGQRLAVSLGSRALAVLSVLIEARGELVSKQAIMDAVWPGIAVEESNLTVQISALRRALDEGRKDGSSIQTIPGRGYRFALAIRPTDQDAAPGASEIVPDSSAPAVTPVVLRHEGRHWFGVRAVAFFGTRYPASWIGVSSVAFVALMSIIIWRAAWNAAPSTPPRLSIVVLPFGNFSDDPGDNHLADAITDDLTSDLAERPDTFVVARASAQTYRNQATDVRRIGQDLGVGYALEGSVRRLGPTIRVNAQLISTETGAHLWTDRFEQQVTDLSDGQNQIVVRMYDGLRKTLIDIENARSLRERPTDPDAFDLMIRARALQQLQASPQRDRDALALYERALLLDPNSAAAMAQVAYYLIALRRDDWATFGDMRRAERLLRRALEITPSALEVLNTYVYWLRTVGRCPEVIEAVGQAIEMRPIQTRIWTGLYNELSMCKFSTGDAEKGIDLQEQARRNNPSSPFAYNRYRKMGFGFLLLGRYDDAIANLKRSLAINPEATDEWTYRWLAAAYAHNGRFAEARNALSEADRRWPYDTVRGHFPDYSTSTVYAEQIRRYQAGLRLAGERDHADEDADFGVPPDGDLHGQGAGPTPTTAPGVRTLRTPDLAGLLATASPVVLDTMTYSWGQSIPGAIGLRFSGLAGSFTDEAQAPLRSKMRDLTGGDLTRPIVAVGWNSERFDGRNLALRLAALGYTHVYWYRGGREAWEVNGLPETQLAVQRW